ncbi:MAG: THUMP domain-containing class I SAM-dependent RNA methyltransferase [Myxococcota bacterium]
MARRPPDRRYFATTALGLEAALEGELRSLGVRAVRRATGGVAFQGDRTTMMRACLHLRTAHRVLWNLGTFEAHDDEALYAGARRVARWRGLVPPDRTFAVHATARGEAFRDARFAALKVKDAVADDVRDTDGARPDVDPADPDVRVHVRIVGQRVTVSLDAAGESLHARRYRTAAGEAPLRETLAAGLLLLAGWDGDTPLMDPLCGAGTLVIEGAWIAANRAPGLLRERMGFERWPGHKPRRYERLKEEARAREQAVRVSLLGCDRDAAVVEAARANARRAGASDLVRFEVGDLDDARPPEGPPGLLVANPPYGERLGEVEAIVPLYEALGRALGGPFAGWRGAILSAHREHTEALGRPIRRHRLLKNGPLDVRLLEIAA